MFFLRYIVKKAKFSARIKIEDSQNLNNDRFFFFFFFFDALQEIKIDQSCIIKINLIE